MPWSIEKRDDEYCVVKDDDGEVEGCHSTREEAEDQLTALNIAEQERAQSDAPNYRVSDTDQKCANCEYSGADNVCTLYDFTYQLGYTCDSWQPEVERGILRKIYELLRSFFQSERSVSVGDIAEQVFLHLLRQDEPAYLMDLYRNDDGEIYAIANREGRLYSIGVETRGSEIRLGDWQRVEIEFEPTETRTVIRQQSDGRWRFVSVSATAVLNKDGEIDSRNLFDSFIEHAEETGEYPIRQFYHAGEPFKTGEYDYLARDGYCYITSGVYDETELARREREALQRNPEYWGESIGYYPTERPSVESLGGVDIPVYEKGINREISILPRRDASGYFTTVSARMEVTRMLGERQMEAFVELFGDEGAAREWLEKNVDDTNRQINFDKLIARARAEAEEVEVVDEVDDEIETETETEEVDEQVREIEIDDAILDQMVERVVRQMTEEEKAMMAALVERVDSLEETVGEMRAMYEDDKERTAKRLVELERDEAEKLHELENDMPRKSRTLVTYRPRRERAEDKEDTRTADEMARDEFAAMVGGV